MARVTVELADLGGMTRLDLIVARGQTPAPLLKAIGESLTLSTRRRFATSTAPDGQRWAPNARSTYESLVNRSKGAVGKRGRLTKKGAGVVMSKRPLIGESRQLSTQIVYQLTDGGYTLLLGSPMKYAATHQFGARKGQFGTSRKGRPIPWGDIPARPFLGLSAQDRATIIDLTRQFLRR